MYKQCSKCKGRGYIGRDDCEACHGNGFHYTPPREPLAWIDDRWHCQGEAIHAGNLLEMNCPDESWILVRIESGNHGKNLIAFHSVHGQLFTRAIDPKIDDLRWPETTQRT